MSNFGWVVMIIIFVFIVPYLWDNKKDDIKRILFARVNWRKKPEAEKPKETKKPGTRNGTQEDLALFLRRLMRYAKKNGIETVIPGRIRYGQYDVNISAILIGQGMILGIYCIAYGGKITPYTDSDTWKQEMNDETRDFPSPSRICDEMEEVLSQALKSDLITARSKVVPVFIAPDVVFSRLPQDIYSTESLFYYLDNAGWVKEGSLNVDHISEVLHSLVPMQELNEAVNKKSKKIKDPS